MSKKVAEKKTTANPQQMNAWQSLDSLFACLALCFAPYFTDTSVYLHLYAWFFGQGTKKENAIAGLKIMNATTTFLSQQSVCNGPMSKDGIRYMGYGCPSIIENGMYRLQVFG